MSEDCTNTCVCEGLYNYPVSNGWYCQDITCDVNQWRQCDVKDGVGGCHCMEGFVERDGVCQGRP